MSAYIVNEEDIAVLSWVIANHYPFNNSRYINVLCGENQTPMEIAKRITIDNMASVIERYPGIINHDMAFPGRIHEVPDAKSGIEYAKGYLKKHIEGITECIKTLEERLGPDGEIPQFSFDGSGKFSVINMMSLYSIIRNVDYQCCETDDYESRFTKKIINEVGDEIAGRMLMLDERTRDWVISLASREMTGKDFSISSILRCLSYALDEQIASPKKVLCAPLTDEPCP